MIKPCPLYCSKKNPIITVLQVLIFSTFLLALSGKLHGGNAQIMEDGNYQIRLQDVYGNPPTPTAKPINITSTPIPTPLPIRSFGQSEIAASESFVDFGSLAPTNPVLRQLSFSIKGGYLPFFLYQHMDHDLLNNTGDAIPPTSCDNGSCSKDLASLWISTLTYGLGFRCDNLQGSICPDDFIEKNAFRPLGGGLDRDGIVASGTIDGRTDINLTFKLIIPGTQPSGNYQAQAFFILIPGI